MLSLLYFFLLLTSSLSLHTYIGKSFSISPKFTYTTLLDHEKLPDAVARMVNERPDADNCNLDDAEDILSYGALSVGRDDTALSPPSHSSNRPDTSPWYQVSRPVPPSTLPSPHLRLLYPVRVFPSLVKTRILHEDETFVVVDKPSGVPSQPYAGNSKETLANYVKYSLDFEGGPRLLNRVDLCVSGVVVFSKTALGRKVWDGMNKRREVKKEYLAVSEQKLEVGVKKVLMCTTSGQGRLETGGKGKVLLSTDFEGWKNHPSWSRCILNVKEVTEVPGHGYEHRVHLVTGRKHQIRATFAYFGACLVGDTLYEGMEGVGIRKNADEGEVREVEDRLGTGETPRGDIGLRAVKIMIGKDIVDAGEDRAWWRTGSRKSHTLNLDDNNQRSEYYSTYHARPEEIDRRHNSGSTAQTAKAISGESTRSDTIFSDDVTTFSKLGLHVKIAEGVEKCMGIKKPTGVQVESCRVLLGSSKGGTNLFIQSETGSGKTLAYLLPILHHLTVDGPTGKLKKIDRQTGGTRCLVLCPTRELATQTILTANKLCAGSFNWVVPGCLSGGEKRKSEKARLKKGVTILIGTPGRVLDHLQKTESLMMSLKGKLEWVVLDEADRLLDMGLGKQVEEITQHLKANSPGSGRNRDGVTWRTVLVSATVTGEIRELAEKKIGGVKGKWEWARGEDKKSSPDDSSPSFSSSTPHQLSQSSLTVSAKLRLPALTAFLASRIKDSQKVIVFMSTCDGVDYHRDLFNSCPLILPSSSSQSSEGLFGSIPILRMHGSVPHSERTTTMAQFASSPSCVLLATDVAARGLNLPGVDWIVQYDPPSETSDYVHRAGRAARAGAKGCALLFLLPSEVKYLEVLKSKGMRGMKNLSLSSTLNEAAAACKDVTREGLRGSSGGFKDKENRRGEAFAKRVHEIMEDVVTNDDRDRKATAADAKRAARDKVGKEDGEKGSKKAWREGDKEAERVMAEGLLAKGRKAYTAFIRAYSAKEKAVRHIFSSRALHIGHVARSFALKDKPSDMKNGGGEKREDADADVLKVTGKRRSENLAFGVREERGTEEVHEREEEKKGKGKGRGKGKKREPEAVDNKQGKKKRTATGSFTPKLVEFEKPKFEKPKEKKKETTAGDKRKLMMQRAMEMQGQGMNAM